MTSTLKNDSISQKLIGRDILFFDGECVLCHNMVKRLLSADEDKHFLLAAQQGQTGKLILERHGINIADLSTVYLVTNCGTPREELFTRSAATLYAMKHFPKYKLLSKLLSIVPRFILDIGYRMVAATRYQVFGKTNNACAMPTADLRDRILD